MVQFQSAQKKSILFGFEPKIFPLTAECFNLLSYKIISVPLIYLPPSLRSPTVGGGGGQGGGKRRGRGRRGRMKNYGYHIIENSPWVIYSTISIMSIMISNILYMNRYTNNYIMYISIISIIINMIGWWEEVIKEGSIRGEHTRKVQEGIMKGYILFIVSEVCIFITLFYVLLYTSIIPDIHIGNRWPPIGIETIDYKSIPLLNTIILFYSGITITIGQYKIKEGKIKESKIYVIYTIILGIIFVLLQGIEYKNSNYNITDSIYGNIFYTLTGLHGIHVIIGILYIYIAYIRMEQYTRNHHMNYIMSAIYYHFVDIVWLFLFALLYIWSTGLLSFPPKGG